MNIIDIIQKKRDGRELCPEEISFFVNGAAKETIENYQLSALLMAIFLKGMNEKETALLTDYMAKSGDVLDLSKVNGITVDKHSTGGVGDKTTVIIAPVAAALGCKVAKMSGRALGHTGGTIDKLESIPGFSCTMSPEKFISQVNEIGLAVSASSLNMTPADKKLYALRDVTATVDNISLIASSVMSKKLAGGAKNIVLDVKYGSGAFMKNYDNAKALADEMIKIGTAYNRKVFAFLTDMNTPLGMTIGNAIEICEAVEVLKGREEKSRLREICVELASKMYSLCFDADDEQSKNEVNRVLNDGTAYEKFIQLVKAQGGDTSVFDDYNLFFKPESEITITAKADGKISQLDAYTLANASCEAGTGRLKLEDSIDNSAGIKLHKLLGDTVKKSEPILTVYGKKQMIKQAIKTAEKSIKISE